MSAPIAIALLAFWLFLAYRSFERGDTVMAVVFVVVGILLTVWRLRSAKAK